MSDKPIIAIDAMGGDFGPEVVVPAAIKILKKNKWTFYLNFIFTLIKNNIVFEKI